MDKNKVVALIITLLVFGAPILWIYRTEIVEYFHFEQTENSEESSYTTQKKPTKKTPSVKSKSSKSSNGSSASVGKVLDSFNGVDVYENGAVRNVNGRNTTSDGYNLGLKYQCVEYVKRYYYQVFHHKMPNSYGHAKEFYSVEVSDGEFNSQRGLTQYKNGSISKPKVNDILVYGAAPFNEFGHVAIVSKVTEDSVECISQNLGQGNGTRRTYALSYANGRWKIDEPYILGWLRK